MKKISTLAIAISALFFISTSASAQDHASRNMEKRSQSAPTGQYDKAGNGYGQAGQYNQQSVRGTEQQRYDPRDNRNSGYSDQRDARDNRNSGYNDQRDGRDNRNSGYFDRDNRYDNANRYDQRDKRIEKRRPFFKIIFSAHSRNERSRF